MELNELNNEEHILDLEIDSLVDGINTLEAEAQEAMDREHEDDYDDDGDLFDYQDATTMTA